MAYKGNTLVPGPLYYGGSDNKPIMEAGSIQVDAFGGKRLDSVLSSLTDYTTETIGLIYEKSTDGTYYTCTGLKMDVEDNRIYIPAFHDGLPVKKIGYAAFQNRTQLTHVYISEGIETVEMYAFYTTEEYEGSSKLECVVIPKSVTTMGSYIFKSIKSTETGYAKKVNPNLTIYCEAEEEPDGWSHAPSNAPTWFYTDIPNSFENNTKYVQWDVNYKKIMSIPWKPMYVWKPSTSTSLNFVAPYEYYFSNDTTAGMLPLGEKIVKVSGTLEVTCFNNSGAGYRASIPIDVDILNAVSEGESRSSPITFMLHGSRPDFVSAGAWNVSYPFIASFTLECSLVASSSSISLKIVCPAAEITTFVPTKDEDDNTIGCMPYKKALHCGNSHNNSHATNDGSYWLGLLSNVTILHT